MVHSLTLEDGDQITIAQQSSAAEQQLDEEGADKDRADDV